MKTRCSHYIRGKGCGHLNYKYREVEGICPPDATSSCFIDEPEKPKQVFVWSRYTSEEESKVYDAIMDIINEGRKVCVTIQEVDNEKMQK